MKKHFFILSLLLFSLFAEAQKNKIYFYELDKIRGLYFRPNTIEPFTGLAFDKHPNGKKKMHIPIKDGKVHGKVKEWERNGEKVYEAEYDMGTQIGVERQWYATGAKKLEIPFLNGKAHGVCTEWFKNGSKKSEGYYANGKEQGDHYWWYLTGDKDQLVPYKNGKVHGKVINWYRNGQIKLEKEYQNGSEHGSFKEYFQNGKLKSEAHYENGKLHGESRIWSRKGFIIGIQTFEHGNLVKDINYRSGSIRLADGYLQVFNEKESFFTVKITGEEVRPRKSIDIIYAVDSMLLQLFNYSTSLFVETEKKENLSDKQILEIFQKKEADLIRQKTDHDIQVQTEWFTTPNGLQALHWYFRAPAADSEEQTPRTPQQEHYISLICNKQILNLYSILTNANTEKAVVEMLKNIATQVTVKTERIDLNTILPPLETQHK